MTGWNVEPMAVISTAHLPEDECTRADAGIQRGDLPLPGLAREESFIVSVVGETLDGFPVLNRVLCAAREEGFDWLMFDRDAPTVPGLPKFDW